MSMVEEKDIQEFMDSGMLWLVNSFLHVFGWAIVAETGDDGKFVRLFPARVKFRGFSESNNADGYIKVSKFMKDHAEELLKEANS